MVVIVNVNIFPSKVVLEYQSTTTYHAHTSVFGKSDFSFSRKCSQQMSWIFKNACTYLRDQKAQCMILKCGKMETGKRLVFGYKMFKRVRKRVLELTVTYKTFF